MSFLNTPLVVAALSCSLALSISVTALNLASAETLKKEKSQIGKGNILVYVGGYTKGKTQGIFIYSLNQTTGDLKPIGVGPDVESPSYLAISPNHKYLYAVNEVDTFEGKPNGGVSSYSINSTNGALTLLNSKTSGGTGPCHISTDAAGKHVFVANYGSGSAEVLPINKDGSLGDPSCFMQHSGTGPDPARQEGPHAHSAITDPTGKYVLVNDLGLDKIVVYKYNAAKGTIDSTGVAPGVTPPGSGPRHFVFDHDGQHGYCINEMKSTVTAFKYDSSDGMLTEYQTISTLPAGYKGNTSCAEIVLSPDGKFLYGSNRGADSIAIFAVSPTDHTLSVVGHQATGGQVPRCFNIDPSGNFVVAANQASNSLVVFKRNKETGTMTQVGTLVTVEAPVSVVFLKTGK